MKMKKINKYVWFLGLLILSATMVIGGIRCNNKSNSTSSGGSSNTTNVTLSGLLISGTVALTTTKMSPLSNASLNTLDVPLTGDVLYCVSFSNSPAAAKSQPSGADGSVNLTIAAQNVPFGCFVLDTSGKVIASLVFSGSNANSAAITVSGNANLGTITVDVSTGLAKVSLPSDGTLVSSTPTGTDCPIGKWVGDFGPSPCASGDITATVWIAKTTSGQYTVSFTFGPVYANAGSCGLVSSADNISATYSGQVFSSTIGAFDSGCPSKIMITQMTVDASCTTGTVKGSAVGCQNCCDCTGDNSCTSQFGDCSCSNAATSSGCSCTGVGCTTETTCAGCGSLTCPSGTYTMTRQ